MRVSGWPQILDAKIEEWRPRACNWGTDDCCQFVRAVVLALTGEDRGASFPAYATHAEASAMVEAAGGMGPFLSGVFGASVPAARAQRGDVVMVGDDPTAGICLGATAACFGPAGLTFVPMRAASCAWRV